MAITTRTTAIAATLMVVANLLVSLPVNAQPPVSPPVAEGPSASGVPLTAPSPSLDCFSYLINMSDCLTFVEAGSNLTKPDKKCCPELAGLVESQPICLCQLLSNPGGVGVDLNLSKALALPKVCKVSTPSVSVCAAIGAPVGVPTAASGVPAGFPTTASEPAASGVPVGFPTTASEPAAALSPAGLAASPASVNNENNGRRSFEASFLCILVGIISVIWAAFF